MKRTQKYLKRFFRVLSLGLIIGVLYFLVYNNSYEAYSFTPSESKVLRDGKTYLDAMGQREAMRSLAQSKKLYESYNASTDVYARAGTLMRIYGYQDSLGQYSEAKKTLESVLALQMSTNTLRAYALLLAKMGDPKEALIYIDGAISLAPTLPDLWNTKIDLLRIIHKNNLRQLDTTYRQALQNTEDNIDIIAGYAHYLEQMGRKGESIAYYKKATEMNPAGKYEYQDAIIRQQ